MEDVEYKEENITFTPREEEILRLLADVRTNKDICEKLSIVEGTLFNHFKNIQRKTCIYGSRKILLTKYAIEYINGKREAVV